VNRVRVAEAIGRAEGAERGMEEREGALEVERSRTIAALKQEVLSLKDALAAEGRRLGMMCGELGSELESVARDGGRAAAETGRLRGRVFELQSMVEQSERRAAEEGRKGAALRRELDAAKLKGDRAEGRLKELEGEVLRREGAVRDVQMELCCASERCRELDESLAVSDRTRRMLMAEVARCKEERGAVSIEVEGKGEEVMVLKAEVARLERVIGREGGGDEGIGGGGGLRGEISRMELIVQRMEDEIEGQTSRWKQVSFQLLLEMDVYHCSLKWMYIIAP
jgi:chromosome segregation ATPase